MVVFCSFFKFKNNGRVQKKVPPSTYNIQRVRICGYKPPSSTAIRFVEREMRDGDVHVPGFNTPSQEFEPTS